MKCLITEFEAKRVVLGRFGLVQVPTTIKELCLTRARTIRISKYKLNGTQLVDVELEGKLRESRGLNLLSQFFRGGKTRPLAHWKGGKEYIDRGHVFGPHASGRLDPRCRDSCRPTSADLCLRQPERMNGEPGNCG
jgi:hypothetical protein